MKPFDKSAFKIFNAFIIAVKILFLDSSKPTLFLLLEPFLIFVKNEPVTKDEHSFPLESTINYIF
jgi:hypothetical protein